MRSRFWTSVSPTLLYTLQILNFHCSNASIHAPDFELPLLQHFYTRSRFWTSVAPTPLYTLQILSLRRSNAFMYAPDFELPSLQRLYTRSRFWTSVTPMPLYTLQILNFFRSNTSIHAPDFELPSLQCLLHASDFELPSLQRLYTRSRIWTFVAPTPLYTLQILNFRRQQSSPLKSASLFPCSICVFLSLFLLQLTCVD
jgi:hypothetical protein